MKKPRVIVRRDLLNFTYNIYAIVRGRKHINISMASVMRLQYLRRVGMIELDCWI